jgi:hypothetical protein
MLEPVFMKLGVYIMAAEPISTAYFINPFHLFVCLYVYPTIVARQWPLNTFPLQRIHATEEIIGYGLFYTIRIVSKESLWVWLRIPLLLLGNGSVNIPAVMKNYWRSHFLCGPCRIKGK